MDLDKRLFDLATKVDDRLGDLRGRVTALESGGGGGGAAVWGGITGLLSAQLDLTAALAGKQPVGSYLTGNQAITLSGDASGSGSTAIAVTIGNASGASKGLMSAADFTKLGGISAGATVNSTDAFLLSRANHTGTQAVGTITGLGVFATSTDAANLTGTVAAARIAANSLALGKLATAAAASIVGATAAGDHADLTPAQAKGVLAIASGDVSGLAAIATSGSGADLTNGSVTLAKQANMATASVVYRKTAGAGAPEVQTLATLKTDLNLTGTNSGDQTITLTGDVTGSGTGSFAATIGNNIVSYAKMQDVSATNRFLGRITASAGDPEELTGTQATSLLDTFTSVLKGLAPASGGGTANFLRADGTWATPTASAAAGGADRQVQFNNATAIDGAAHVDIDAQGDLRLDSSATPTAPGADQTTFIPCRIAASGGRVWPKFKGEDGINITMATHQGRNSIVWGQAAGSATTSIASIGGTALTSVGTATARNFATTSRLTRAKRLAYVSAATAGAAAGLYASSLAMQQCTVGGAAGGGFLAVFRFAVSDASLVAGAHAMIGMRTATTAPGAAVNPNTLLNLVVLAQTNGSANWQICYGGSAAQTPIDTGIAINITDLLEFTLYARPDDATKIAWRLENISAGTVATGVLTGVAGTALPANTTVLGPLLWRSNNATAAAIGIDIVSYYIESDI